MNSFNKIGGTNTLRSVWLRLKGSHRVRGSKRSASESESFQDERKKVKKNSNVSSTIDKLEGINLKTSSSSGWGTSRMESLSLNEVFRDGESSSGLSDVSRAGGTREDDVVEYDGDSEASEERAQLSSDPPGLTSSESSRDSGRSDTWVLSGGIVRGVRRVCGRTGGNCVCCESGSNTQ